MAIGETNRTLFHWRDYETAIASTIPVTVLGPRRDLCCHPPVNPLALTRAPAPSVSRWARDGKDDCTFFRARTSDTEAETAACSSALRNLNGIGGALGAVIAAAKRLRTYDKAGSADTARYEP